MSSTLSARASLREPPLPEVFDVIVAAPFGAVGVITAGEHISSVMFLTPDYSEQAPRTALGARAKLQLHSYFVDPDTEFDLPLAATGSPFQRRVWSAISAIKVGATRRYGEIAAELGSAARAVGQACGDNRYPLVIPCHRVVAAAGGLGGFAHHTEGFHRTLKEWLLAHEAPRGTLV